jgi:hypothetical protein
MSPTALLPQSRIVAEGDLAQAAQDLVQALRLWYAEIEFGLGEVRPDAGRLLAQLNYPPVFKS